MVELIPSLLVESAQEFERRLRLIDTLVKTVHVDILDGTVIPHVSWHDARAIGDIATPVHYEIHLMVENPLPIVEEWKRNVPTLQRAIIHAELDRPVGLILEEIRQVHKLEVVLAFNPETTIKDTWGREANLDGLLAMGVHPGASGQPFLGELILENIRRLRALFPTQPIACDGGVTPENAQAIVKAGATRLVSAGAIFHRSDPQTALKAFGSVLY